MGERAPQFIQNLAIRDYCIKKKLNFLLSAVEYAIDDSTLILDEIISNIRTIDGIAMYSLFQLPTCQKKRFDTYSDFIKNRKSMHFILENLVIEQIDDIKIVENIWNVKHTLPKCLSQI